MACERVKPTYVGNLVSRAVAVSDTAFVPWTLVVSLGAGGWSSLLTERSLDEGSVRTLEK